jgi:trimethylamine--corrinoid protein Co-methyltransferase
MIMDGGFDGSVKPKYRLLSQNQIEAIHRATLRVLETTGIRVAHEEGLELLLSAGCRRKARDIVLIPDSLVEDSIRSAPSCITIYNRLGQEVMRLEGRNSYYGPGTDLIRTEDLYSGEIRPSVLQDVINAARLCDYCANIDFAASFALPADVPTNTMYLACLKAQMENSIKPIFFTAAGRKDLAYAIEMAAAVAGGQDLLRQKPFIIHYSEPTPPLTHSHGAVSKLFLCAEQGIPICYTPAAMLGGSAPVTLAGGLVQANAEALSGIVLHQLKARGAPIISGVALSPLDMKTSCISYAAPECRLSNSAFADMYHHYRLPLWSTTGSDSHTFDAQASMEHAFATLTSSLDGANLIHDIAYLGQGLLGNPASIIMCDEIISFVKRVLRGFEINSEMMAWDVIDKVGPGGDYLAEKHTLRHFRTELWRPSLLNRSSPQAWSAAGSKRYEERVTHRAIEILATHQPEPLPDSAVSQLAEIVSRAEAELAKMQFVA